MLLTSQEHNLPWSPFVSKGREYPGRKTEEKKYTVFVIIHELRTLVKFNPLLSLTARWKYLRVMPENTWKTKMFALSLLPQKVSSLKKNNIYFSFSTHQSRLFCSSCSPVGGRVGGTGSDTARTQGTRGSWYWCPDAASSSSHQMIWPPQTAASWWFLPLLLAHSPPQPHNGLPTHHYRSNREGRRQKHHNGSSKRWS